MGLDHNLATLARHASFDIAPDRDSFVIEALKKDVKTNYGMSPSLWQSRALRSESALPGRYRVRPSRKREGNRNAQARETRTFLACAAGLYHFAAGTLQGHDQGWKLCMMTFHLTLRKL